MEVLSDQVPITVEIERVFEREFGPVAGKVDRLLLSYDQAVKSQDQRIARPGIYVWLKGNQVIKVGRSFTNACKRALEHIRDNTEGTMKEMEGNPGAFWMLNPLGGK